MTATASLIFALLTIGVAAGQELAPPPDFGQSRVMSAVEDVRAAWTAWIGANKDLEEQVFGLPMVDARQRIQRAFSGFLAFADKRREYNEAVLNFLAATRPDTTRAAPVRKDVVATDAIQLLGVNESLIQKKLEALRAAPDWTRIRRAVQTSRREIQELQDVRRADIHVDLPLRRSAAAPNPVVPIAYRDSETQLRQALAKLWQSYYQSLVDAVERKPGGSLALVASMEVPAAAATSSSTVSARGAVPVAGTWTYVEGSQKFNGAGEPRQVVLELWMDQGALAGRYRAQLPDFDGVKHVDLNLSGKVVPGNTQTLMFRSEDPEASGRIVIEGPNGAEVMVMRAVEPGSPIPRGREFLTRR